MRDVGFCKELSYFFELASDLRVLVAFQIASSLPTAEASALKGNAIAERKSRVP